MTSAIISFLGLIVVYLVWDMIRSVMAKIMRRASYWQARYNKEANERLKLEEELKELKAHLKQMEG